MNDPTPENLDSAAAVRVYLAANLVGASTGLLSPRIAVAGVEETDAGVTLHFGVDAPVGDDYPEIRDIVDYFGDGFDWIRPIAVSIKEWRSLVTSTAVHWTYLRRPDEASEVAELSWPEWDVGGGVPSIDLPARVPVWRNYLCAQLARASAGLLSSKIVLLGFSRKGEDVTIRVFVDMPMVPDDPDLQTVARRFEELTGGMLTVRVDVDEWVLGARYEGVDWTYQRWIDDMELDQ